MALVPLGFGRFAEIDDIDVVAVFRHNWFLNGKEYPRSSIEGKTTTLHKFIAKRMQLEGRIDHKDRNPLNCKRDNLRIATFNQNNANSTKRYSKTGYPGVYKNYDAFVAIISINNKNHHICRSKSPEFCFEMYKKRHREIHGEFSPY